MFNFVKKQDFTEPNEPAPLMKMKTKTQAKLNMRLPKKISTNTSLEEEAKAMISQATPHVGSLPFGDIPDVKKMSIVEDKDGNSYLGE